MNPPLIRRKLGRTHVSAQRREAFWLPKMSSEPRYAFTAAKSPLGPRTYIK